MEKFKKFSLLNNDQLAKIKGGIVENSGGISLFGADENDRRKCSCSGAGDNHNGANRCYCTDGPCGSYK